MKINVERTRIIFTEFNPAEKQRIDDLVGTMDKVFSYEDPDGKMICLPTGMLDSVKKTFPKVSIEDHSSTYWNYATITPVTHNAQPRNQLQVDFINFVMEEAAKKRKLAGILSPGTGKAEPLSRKLPAPSGDIYMGDVKPGTILFDRECNPTLVTDIFPQGVKDIYRILLWNGRDAMCSAEHLWNVRYMEKGILLDDKEETISLVRLMRRHYTDYAIPYWDEKTGTERWSQIRSINFHHQEEAQCIMVDNPDHLYMTQGGVITHNTFMACYSAIKLGLRTLIIAPTTGIKDQWAETLINMFNVDPSKVKKINTPGDFINIRADFVVVSQASLAVLNKTYDLERIMKLNKFGIKVIDEVQMWFHNIIKVDGNSNICHNWYLTGTFGRSGEEENTLYQEMFGDLAIFREKDKKPTIFNRKPGNVYGMKPHMHVRMMWTKSGLSKEEIASVTSSMRYSERAGKWMRYGISIPAYTELVIPSDGRMTKFLRNVLKVVEMANNEVRYGKMLVLSPTVASVLVLEKYIKKMYPKLKVGTIHSRNPKAENDRVKAECDIMISTVKSCGTGFDVKDLSKLVVAEQFKSWILADQVSGRLRRRPDGKDTYMWDIADAQIPQLRAWANARADVLRKKAKTFKVIDL